MNNTVEQPLSKDPTGVLINSEAGPREEWFYGIGSIAYRSGNYKIHLSSKDRSSNPDTRARESMKTYDPPLLFDLSKDIGEQHKINAEHPEVVERLLQELNAYRN